MLHQVSHHTMASNAASASLKVITFIVVLLILPAYIAGSNPIYSFIDKNLRMNNGALVNVLFGAISFAFVKRAFRIFWGNGKNQSMYGLQHGRLHLQVPTAMWMNMGYWANMGASGTMAEACRDLLNAVISEAWGPESATDPPVLGDRQQTKCVIDLGIGCGDQTIYLMSKMPLRTSDEGWWDQQSFYTKISSYIGITKDPLQAKYASERINELVEIRMKDQDSHVGKNYEGVDVALFCADAAKPTSWNDQLQAAIQRIDETSRERWVLALDTAYHFSPSRWPIIHYSRYHIHASFMAFDLCISETATLPQKMMLRLLAAMMGAPWANFITPQEYRKRLREAGYRMDMITIKDISEHVFSPLAQYLDTQDKKLQSLGLGIGGFNIAKSMFRWWGRTGLVRGVIVVARQAPAADDEWSGNKKEM